VKERSVILGFSIHFPLGSDPAAAERSYQARVRPLLSRIYANPALPVAVHLSGAALKMLDSAHPEIVMLIKELARRKQAEIVGGGYSHPRLPLIPLTDRLGQIEQATTLIRQAFDKRPRGCLLPGMHWELQLASTLNAAGIEYTFLDESLFRVAGCDPRLPQVTEDQGRTVTVFPAKASFGAALDADPSAFARAVAADFPSGGGVLAYFLDAVAMDGDADAAEFELMVERFLKTMIALRDDLRPSLPSRFLGPDAQRGRAYFSDAGTRGRPLQGTPAARLYGKMYFVHGLANQLRGDKARKKAARELVWKAQGHEAYHCAAGSDGPAVSRARSAAYAALIEAEVITREKGVFMPSLVPIDYDFDGYEEYLFQGSELDAYAHRSGGAIVELDVLQAAANILNPRRGGLGVLFEDAVEQGDSSESRPQAAGAAPFTVEACDSARADLKLAREWLLPSGAPARLEKRYAFRRNGVYLTASVVNIGTSRLAGRYANASTFATRLKDGQQIAVSAVTEAGEVQLKAEGTQRLKAFESFQAADAKGKTLIEVIADGKPACEASLFEEGDARLAFSWKFSLEPGERFEASLQYLIHSRRARSGD